MKDQSISLVRSLLLVLFVLLVGAVPSFGQQVTGGLSGIVTDESKAVIPGAEVTAKNSGTGAEVTTTTNENGVYRITSLIPGVYTISVTAANFKRAEVAQVTVRLGVDTGVDIAMQIGVQSDVVEVTGGEVLIERDTAQISTNYDARKVTELPNNVAGGGIDAIALLTPGVVEGADAGFGNTNGANISSNGGRTRSNNFSIDGQDNNDISVTGPAVFISNTEAIQEFQIVTNNFSAEYGQAGGAIVNIVTKGGTNDFHGTLTYFHRDRKLFDTLTLTERRTGKKEADPLLNSTFGFTFGGPIKKDKVFYFVSYEGIRETSSGFFQSGSSGLTLTPNGIATALQFVSQPIANVINATSPFLRPVGNPTIQSDVATRVINVNIGGKMVPLEFGAVQRNISQPIEDNLTTARIDYNVSANLRFLGRYLYQKQEFANADFGRTNAGFPSDAPSRSQQLGATLIYQVSPRAVNEFRFNFSRLRANFGGGATPSASQASQALASFTMPSGFLSQGPLTSLPQGRINDNYQFLDNFSVTFGKHSLKMGADFKRRLADSNFLPNQNGSFRFSTLERFFNNNPNSASLAVGPNVLNFTEFDQFYFFEDTIRIRDNFTLSLGLRYENTGQPINILNEITRKREEDPTTAFFDQKLPLEARVFPAVDTDNNNFAPRVGFTYSPRFAKAIFGENKTVIRGGFGISYDLAFYNILTNSAGAAPVVLSTTITPPSGGTLMGLVPADPTGPGVRAALASFLPLNRLDPRRLNRTTVANDFHNPYTEQYSIGLQRQFGNNTVIEARYVGTHSIGQFQSVNRNPQIDTLFADFPQLLPPGVRPSPNGRLIADQGLQRERINGASSTYNSLQVRFDTRIANSLTLGSSYTFSKQIDNVSEIFGSFQGGNTIAFAQNPFDRNDGERALGAFDFRNVFSVNFIYDIPFMREQRGVLGKLLGGYEITGTYRATPGQRYTPIQGFFDTPYTDTNFNVTFNGSVETTRPFLANPNAPANTVAIDVTSAINIFGLDPKTSSPSGFVSLNALNGQNGPVVVPVTLDQVRFVYNTSVSSLLFGSPYGTAGRNSLKGDNFSSGNFGLFKNTKLNERFELQFRAEFFNVFNHPNKGVPDPLIDDAGTTFADVNENSVNLATGNNGTRTIQFGIKLSF